MRGNRNKLTTGMTMQAGQAHRCRGQRRGLISQIRTAAFAAASGIAGFASLAHAQFVWDGGASPDNNWNTANNWNVDSGFPGSGDSAQWLNGTSPASSTVDLSTPGAAANDLQVADVAVAFNLNNFALTVGGGESVFDGNNGHATFNGPGSVSFAGPVVLGKNLPFAPPSGHARFTAQGGATINTSGMTVGHYRGAGIVSIADAGTVWNSTGIVHFGSSSAGGYTYTQPRVQLHITDGGRANFQLGTYETRNDHGLTFSRFGVNESKVVVDGPGSQLNLLGGYGYNFKVGGYGSNSNWEITNGGVLNGGSANLGLSFGIGGTGVNTYTITGAGSKMTSEGIALAMRNTASGGSTSATVVNVGVGGTLEATGVDGSDRSVAVGSNGRLSLQGGTVSVPVAGEVVLRDTDAAAPRATIEGHGTIAGGTLRVQSDSIVRPGAASTGKLTIQSGHLLVESASAQLRFDLSTSDASHDQIELLGASRVASIPGVIDFNNLGSGSAATGILDFLLADTINYNAFTAGDIALNTDNLDSLLATAGYTTRVTGADPTNPGEYRYFIAADVVGSLDALRLQLGGFTGPTIATWNVSTAGDWTNPDNWTGGVPDGVDDEAKFLSAIDATRTVYADIPVTVGTMRFNNANMYHVTGGASLTLEVSAGAALVQVQAGTHKINLPLIIASDTNLEVATDAALKISDPVTVNAGKSVTQSGGGAVLYESTVSVGPGASIQFGNSSHMRALTLAADAVATVTPGANKVLRVDSVDVAVGRLDLKDNKLITRNAVGTASEGTYNGLQGDVQRAYNFGSWNGDGLTTSMPGALDGITTVGVATGEQIRGLGPTDTDVWAGETINGASTIAMYTYAGDANLDGQVDAGDYGVLDAFIQVPGANGYGNGDFNYDGFIDPADYGTIDNTIQFQGAPFPTSGSAAGLAGVTAVPEPASLSVLALGAAGLLGRRRRHAWQAK